MDFANFRKYQKNYHLDRVTALLTQEYNGCHVGPCYRKLVRHHILAANLDITSLVLVIN
jgi:hypothetical protein